MSTSNYAFHWLIAVLLLGGGGGSRINGVGPDSGIVVDTPPQTSISVAPALITKDTTASIGFRSNQENSTFECRIDNGTIDATWAVHTWTVDTVAPTITITVAPQSPTSQTTAVFSFVARETPVSFECALDNGKYGLCESPYIIRELKDGLHAFGVRAQDIAGNQTEALLHEWQIDFSASLSSNTITGTVNSETGPEGGIWVIAETTGLQTPDRKIMVTDEDG